MQQRTALHGTVNAAPPSERDSNLWSKHARTSTKDKRAASISSVVAKRSTECSHPPLDGAPHRCEPHAVRSASLAPENLLISGVLSATDTGKHRTTETAPGSAERRVENCCCHAKSWPWGVVSLRAMGTGYMRLRMGCSVGDGAAQGGVRWEASDARCFAFGKRGSTLR